MNELRHNYGLDWPSTLGHRLKTDERPDKIARIMIELELESQWATCQRGHVASALVTVEGQILLLARNGTPRNQPHCKELATPEQRCQFCIHSETNLINRAARSGLKTEGHNLYTLKRPCLGCSNNIVEAGIAAVYYRWDYDTDEQKEYVLAMFQRQNIYIEQISMSYQEQTFHTLIGEWRSTWLS